MVKTNERRRSGGAESEPKPKAQRSIVPPRPRGPVHPIQRYASAGTVVPPCPSWDHRNETPKRPSAPPYATASNLADTGENEQARQSHTILPVADEEPTTLDVGILLHFAIEDARRAGEVPHDPPDPVAWASPPQLIPETTNSFGGAGDTLSPAVRSAPPPSTSYRGSIAIGTLLGAGLMLGGAGILLVSLTSSAPARCATALESLATSASAALSAPANPQAPAPIPAAMACKTEGPSRQLLSSASPTVPLEASIDKPSQRIGLGLAASNGRPVGFTLRLQSLHTERSTMDWAPAPLRRVVPRFQDNDLTIAGDTSETDEMTHTVRGPLQLRIGKYRDHLTLSGGSGVPEVLWELPGSVDNIDATSRERGAVVAIRTEHDVHVGWVDAANRPYGSLQNLRAEHPATGAVRVDFSGEDAVTAFESHSSSGHSIAVIAARRGSASIRSWTPPSAAGAALLQPAIAAVGSDRWLVAWTERRSTTSKIRMQTLDRYLRPVSAPVDVTSEEERASGGVLVFDESGALFYFKHGVSPREAWAVPVRCPATGN